MKRLSVIIASYIESIRQGNRFMWIWEHSNWPDFNWDKAKITPLLEKAHLAHQAFLNRVSWLQADFAKEAQAQTLEEEAMQTSAIEGELLKRASVRSSVARHLGISQEMGKQDQQIEGLVALLMDASNYHAKLSQEKLFSWHAGLFPTGYSSIYKIHVAAYRLEKMYVMSGPHGKQTTHFEAPPPEKLHAEMESFIRWFNQTQGSLDGILRAGLAHFYFVTLHPFDDGNGRIARALIDLALSQHEKSDKRFYRLSAEIEKHRKKYYDILELSQKNTLDITAYLQWFLDTFIAAIERSEHTLERVLNKALFWQQHYLADLNTRQKKVLNLLLDSGDEFIGNMNTRKYVSINKVSRATAYRELHDMVEKACLDVMAQGRGTNYKLKKLEK